MRAERGLLGLGKREGKGAMGRGNTNASRLQLHLCNCSCSCSLPPSTRSISTPVPLPVRLPNPPSPSTPQHVPFSLLPTPHIPTAPRSSSPPPGALIHDVRAITALVGPARRADVPAAVGAPEQHAAVVLVADVAFRRVDGDGGEGLVEGWHFGVGGWVLDGVCRGEGGGLEGACVWSRVVMLVGWLRIGCDGDDGGCEGWFLWLVVGFGAPGSLAVWLGMDKRLVLVVLLLIWSFSLGSG